MLYHLDERGIEHRACSRLRTSEGIAVVAYTPFGRGSFTRGDRGRERARAHRGTSTERPAPGDARVLDAGRGVFAIPKAARVEHVEENARGRRLALDANEVAAIDAAFPRGEAARWQRYDDERSRAPSRNARSERRCGSAPARCASRRLRPTTRSRRRMQAAFDAAILPRGGTTQNTPARASDPRRRAAGRAQRDLHRRPVRASRRRRTPPR